MARTPLSRPAACFASSERSSKSSAAIAHRVARSAALNVANSSLIWGEVTYNYRPMFGSVFKTNLTLGDAIYMRPRISTTVTRTAS